MNAVETFLIEIIMFIGDMKANTLQKLESLLIHYFSRLTCSRLTNVAIEIIVDKTPTGNVKDYLYRSFSEYKL